MTDQAMKLRWGHININVSNLENSIEFYRKLGFESFIPAIPYLGITAEVDPKPIDTASNTALGLPNESTARACIMQLDNGFPKIDLTEFSDISQRFQAKPLNNADLGLVRICLASANLNTDYEQLVKQGVEFISPPQIAKDGLAEIATCIDPDGTLIELLQVHLEKWPRLE
ncbi:MAG: VOC family protein [Pseudomonadales bacterium]|nr:VOC family protein [Pseudomonadales bacterium]MDG1443723.1 VOC family protein [Pseudomonadales bacterium]